MWGERRVEGGRGRGGGREGRRGGGNDREDEYRRDVVRERRDSEYDIGIGDRSGEG